MRRFNREYAVNLLKEASASDSFHVNGHLIHAIIIDRSKISTDPEERNKIFHVEQMEKDGVLDVCEGSNESWFSLEPLAYDVIDEGYYPNFAKENPQTIIKLTSDRGSVTAFG